MTIEQKSRIDLLVGAAQGKLLHILWSLDQPDPNCEHIRRHVKKIHTDLEQIDAEVESAAR